MWHVIFTLYMIGVIMELIDTRESIATYEPVSMPIDMLFFVAVAFIEFAWPLWEGWNMCIDIQNFVSQKFRRS